MRTRILIWQFLALALMVSTATAATQAITSDAQAVLAAEHQWLKSQQTNNIELLAPLLADKVVYTSNGEKLFDGKNAVLAVFKSYSYSSADNREMRVTLFGRTAVVTGVFVGTLTSAAGKPRNLRLRFTDTWMKMTNDRWLCVASQD